jgi:tetratricopeptide (TPR) repeat protein
MAQVNEKGVYIREKLKKLLSLEELDAVEKNADELIDLGYDYVEQGHYEKAYSLFTTNMQVNGSSPDAVNGLAISLAELGHVDKALEVMDYASKLYPDDPVTLANLAGIYWEKYDYDKAIYYYTQSIELNPLMIDTHFNLINVHYESGELYMAYIASCTLVELFPDDQDAVQIRNDILIDMAISLN